MAMKKKKQVAGKKKSKQTAKSLRKVGVAKKVKKKVSVAKTKGTSKPAKKSVRKKTAAKKPAARPKVKAKIKTSVPKRKISSKKVKPANKRPAKKKSSQSARLNTLDQLSRHDILKKLLIRKREDIVREARAEIGRYIKGEANQLVETALDDGDWSVIDLSADINLRLLESHRDSLLKIDESLRKLREGSYGICEDCGTEISAERLRVMPFAILCRDCQEKKEELDRVTREELPG